MRTPNSKERFEDYLRAHGHSLESLDALHALRAMAQFYVDERAEDVDVDANGDMLLFQWGIYDWGAGPFFEYDITRQLITEDDEGEDEIWQLSLTLRYEPNEEARRLGAGDRWCHSPDGVTKFIRFAKDARVTQRARGWSPRSIELELGPAD